MKKMKMANQKDQTLIRNAGVIIAILFTLMAIITYTSKYITSGVKLSDLLYVSMYLQISVFSGVLLLLIKNKWVKMFLIVNLISFLGFIFKYAYAWLYGSKFFITMMGFIGIGFVLGILFILYFYIKQLWK